MKDKVSITQNIWE